jgi:hypothetical protein
MVGAILAAFMVAGTSVAVACRVGAAGGSEHAEVVSAVRASGPRRDTFRTFVRDTASLHSGGISLE